MTDVTSQPRPTERCEHCGQPLVLGVCGLCGPTRKEPPPPEELPPGAFGAPRPRDAAPSATRSGAAGPPSERTQSLLAIGVALALVSLLASGFLILKVSSLESKIQQEHDARTNTENRIAIVEGGLEAAKSDEQAVHSQLDAQAAADPAAVSMRVQPSVYTILTAEGSLGSAWVADSDHVTARFVTNYHVIANAWERDDHTVTVFQDQGQPFQGTIEQALPDVDLALVDVTADIPALKQSSTTPRPGDAVLAIGSPFGLGGSVTTGAVSALRDIDGLNYIQFSAPVSPGNSGGPLVNSVGEVIGVTEAKAIAAGAEGIAIAIPVNSVCINLKVC